MRSSRNGNCENSPYTAAGPDRKSLERKLTRTALTIIFLFFCGAAFPGAFGADGSAPVPDGSPPVRGADPVLVVSGDNAYPPYEFLENGKPAGFNIDLIRAVSEVMGLRIRIELGPWHG